MKQPKGISTPLLRKILIRLEDELELPTLIPFQDQAEHITEELGYRLTEKAVSYASKNRCNAVDEKGRSYTRLSAAYALAAVIVELELKEGS